MRHASSMSHEPSSSSGDTGTLSYRRTAARFRPSRSACLAQYCRPGCHRLMKSHPQTPKHNLQTISTQYQDGTQNDKHDPHRRHGDPHLPQAQAVGGSE